MADSTSRKVIEYVANIAPALRSIQTLEALNKKLIDSFGKSAPRAVQELGRTIDSIKTKTVIDDKGLAKSIPVIDQVGTSFQTADGKAMTFVETNKVLDDGTVVTTNSLNKMDKNTVSLGQNMARLAKRALLTIPIWLALRTVMTGLTKTIRDGLQTIADQDRALQKAKRNLQGTTESIDSNFKTLVKSSRDLSLKTGESVETIVNAFQKFATVGFDFQTSMAGANGATKLAILLFGDAEETANAFARSMRVLIDTSAGAEDAGTQITKAMAQTAELWKTNAFEVNEFTQSLEKFAPTAKTMNLSAQQTISLLSALSTAGLRGSKAGTLLRTSFTKIIAQTDKLAQSLGVKVNPELDTTFDVFMRTLDAMARTRDEAGKVSPAFEKVVKSIVGLRSADAVKGLIALRQELQKNLATTGDINKFNKEFEEVNKQIFKLNDQIHNTNREIGRAFVIGLVGGKDFQDSLIKITQLLLSMQKRAEQTGASLRGFFTFGFTGAIIGLFKKEKDAIDNTDESFKKHHDTVQAFTDAMGRATAEVIKFSNAESDISFEDEQQILKDIIDNLKEEFQSRGALESQALKMVNSLNKQFHIEESNLDILKRRLDIERALSEEKRLQSRLGSDSIKLFRIAQEQGIEVARSIGEVLAGNTDFDLFVQQGGKALETFKKEFSDIFEQQQALAFFKGNVVPGIKGLTGGTRIPISEEAIRQNVSPFNVEALLRKSQAMSAFERISKANVQQNNTITNNFNVETNNSKDAVDALVKAFDNPQVQKKLANLVTGDNQTNNL